MISYVERISSQNALITAKSRLLHIIAYFTFHHPHAFCFSIGFLDLVQKPAEGGATTGVAVQDFVGQREAIGGDHQRNHHLQTVGPLNRNCDRTWPWGSLP